MPLRPDPDPTVLTTQGLIRESDHSRELTEALLAGDRVAVQTRLDAMDKAIVLVREQSEKVAGLIESGVRHLKEVDEVKFEAIRDRFSDAKLALDVALQGASKAVDAAFSAAKEAASKIEGTFARQIEQLRDLTISQQTNAIDKIDDVRTRLTALESAPRLSNNALDDIRSRLGAIDGQKKGSSDANALILAVGALVVSAIAAMAAVAALFRH